jgi:integrase
VWAYTPPRVRISPAPPLSQEQQAVSVQVDTLKPPPKTSPKTFTKPQSVTPSVTFLSVGEVARRLGKPRKTILEWCHSGKLLAMAIRYGNKTTFQIPPNALELLEIKQTKNPCVQKPQAKKDLDNHEALLSDWVKAMEKGGINGKVYSPLSVGDYKRHIKAYLARYKVLTVQFAQQELMNCPIEQHGKRIKYHKAMVCFAKYLLSQGHIKVTLLEELKTLRPKPNQTPKRVTVNEGELQLILNACETDEESLLIQLLACTGIRASECCAIRLRDIDLEAGRLHIPIAKGGKSRKLGLMPTLVTQIQKLLACRQHSVQGSALFYGFEGKPMDRHGLYRSLMRISKRSGVKVHPHALRRAFVTINANKGRPLVILQRSCGHSSIKTTMSYCLTSEQEVIEAMKGWD